MSKVRVKIFIWLLLCLIAAGLALFTFSRVAQLLSYFQEGADPASTLNIVPNVPPDLKVRLDWLADDPDTGRKMDPFTRTQIESAYLRAWLQWNISFLKGKPFGLETYFAGPALEAVKRSIGATHLQGWSMAQTDLEHQLQLHFYAADGSIVSFTAHDILVAQLMRDETNALISAETTRATYDVIMMLEDGNWRIRHWVRTDVNSLEQSSDTAASTPFVTASGSQLMLDKRPYFIRGINYYPQASPWHLFWSDYDPQVIEADFKLIKELGLNTVRIFVPFEPQPPEQESAGHDAPEAAEAPEAIDPYEAVRHNLEDLLDQAQTNDIKVIVTLFDFRTDYQILLWPNADRDLEQIVPYFAEHKAILAWDLKNEPDLDQPGNTVEMVNAWLTHVAAQVRRYDANHLVTIGWARSDQAHQLADIVDFVSFHDYESAEQFPNRYEALRTAVPDKPLVLTEFGASTWNSFLFPGGRTEPEQTGYYANMLNGLYATDAAGFMAWTLYDFEQVPSSVVGLLPWHSGPQKQYGLINSEQQPKEALFLLKERADLTVKRQSAISRLFKPFRIFWLIMGFIFALIMLRWRQRPLPKGFLSRWLVPRRAKKPQVASYSDNSTPDKR